MPACRSLPWFSLTLLLLVLPALPVAAQDEGTDAAAETAAAANEDASTDGQDAPDGASEGDDSQPGDRAENSEAAEDEDGEDEDGEDEDGEDEEAEEEDAEEEDAEEPQPEERQEPRRLTGLGSVDSPQLPGQPWRVHDLLRPRPPVVAPADADVTVPPPGDAVVLFDGTDLSLWGHRDREDRGVYREAMWNVQDGYFEVTRGGGDLFTLDNFGSVQLHIEWATPEEVRGNAQGRGNSGIKFLGLYEVQILDSYDNRTYADGQAASIYGQYPPDVNVSRAPGQWQSYDIIFEIPRFDDDQLVRPGCLTVLHNGVLVHHRRELAGVTGLRDPVRYQPHPPAGPIMLQDHGNPIRFRNVWVRSLD